MILWSTASCSPTPGAADQSLWSLSVSVFVFLLPLLFSHWISFFSLNPSVTEQTQIPAGKFPPNLWPELNFASECGGLCLFYTWKQIWKQHEFSPSIIPLITIWQEEHFNVKCIKVGQILVFRSRCILGLSIRISPASSVRAPSFHFDQPDFIPSQLSPAVIL